MTEQQSDLAVFYAMLASIPDMERLSKGERLTLMELCQIALQTAFKGETFVDPEGREVYVGFQGGITDDEFYEVLNLLYAHAHTIIVPLFNGESVTPPLTPIWHLDESRRIIFKEWDRVEENKKVSTQIARRCLEHLLIVITGVPLIICPFRQCPVCAKIFIPIKKQTYCSPNCTYKAIEGKRKDDPKRKEALADQQRKRRAQLKETAAKKQRKTKKQQIVNT